MAETPTKTIPVRGGQVALVDAVDYPRLATMSWHLHPKGYPATAILIAGKWTLRLMHQLIFAPPGEDRRTGRKLREGESIGTGRKACPECHILNSSYARECGDCGHVFLRKER